MAAEKKTFRFTDASGKYLVAMILGRHVVNSSIAEKNEIVVYFATGAKSSALGSGGQLWIYDEAHVVVLRRNVKVPPARSQVYLRPVP